MATNLKPSSHLKSTEESDDNQEFENVVHTPLVSSNRCVVSFYKNVLSPSDASNLLSELTASIPWKVEVDNFGPQSRRTCYFGDPECIFSYVGLRLDPLPWTKSLLKVREAVARACGLDASLLTACLANQYRHGQGHIPWHYDEVRAHGSSRIVAALSLGGPRHFLLRSRKKEGEDEPATEITDMLLQSGSVLLMMGSTQEYYEHSLPLASDNEPHRISLTFRSIVAGYETDRELAQDICCTNPSET